MSNERSPRGLCSTTMGTRDTTGSFRGFSRATCRLRFRPSVAECATCALRFVRMMGRFAGTAGCSAGIRMCNQGVAMPPAQREIPAPAGPDEVWEALTDEAIRDAWLQDGDAPREITDEQADEEAGRYAF